MEATAQGWMPAQPETLLWLLAALLLLLLALVLLNWRQWRSSRRSAHRLQGPVGSVDPSNLAQAAGVVSRAQFDQTLEAAAAMADHGAHSVSVLFINLDNFGSVNDIGDHGDGDRVLAQAAQRLRLCAGANVTIAQLGVDEFLMQLPADLASAIKLAAVCRERLAQPFSLPEDREVSLHASIGLAAYPLHGASSRLVAFAGNAMQAVQRAGGDDFMVFEPQMAVDARERAAQLADLRQAIALSQFELYYQPKVEARSLQVTAAEALIRWRHPQRGLISPALFIPLAERHGLIAEIGNWVIEDACRQAAEWRDQGLTMRVAINLSGYQMRQDDLVDRLMAALSRHKLQPSRFTCEITELVAMEDTQATRHSFERLRQAGLHVSIDDFGVAESSLASVRRLEVAELKIDASFVSDVHHSEQARATVTAVVQLGHALGLQVVAEGVETRAQRDQVVALGCDELQGFLFARPMTAQALATWALLDASEGAVTAAFRNSLFRETRPVDE